jgi:hypothetical protein
MLIFIAVWTFVQLHEQAEDRQVLRYVYYFLARLLAESGAQGVAPGGGIPTPNWDALADLNLAGGTVVTRAEVVPLIIAQLTAEATNPDPAGISVPFLDQQECFLVYNS